MVKEERVTFSVSRGSVVLQTRMAASRTQGCTSLVLTVCSSSLVGFSLHIRTSSRSRSPLISRPLATRPTRVTPHSMGGGATAAGVLSARGAEPQTADHKNPLEGTYLASAASSAPSSPAAPEETSPEDPRRPSIQSETFLRAPSTVDTSVWTASSSSGAG
ncbi:hypothetical protein EYF80_059443 [Liparis tanakae]|uniref:Uncharacterized protein n=1 Tax=Liparis tanakae TaxID=230148 RepID=A0A4Z2EPT2_9TELE|nr:hypothetical protein EYF80_059443 [Liparis tanakae]